MADNETQLSKKAQPAVNTEEGDLVAGRKAAVRVGGMRIVQHKTTSNSTQSAAEECGSVPDCTGLAPQPNIDSDHVCGAVVKGNVDYTPQAVQVAHAMKPPKNVVTSHVHHTINQPRK